MCLWAEFKVIVGKYLNVMQKGKLIELWTVLDCKLNFFGKSGREVGCCLFP